MCRKSERAKEKTKRGERERKLREREREKEMMEGERERIEEEKKFTSSADAGPPAYVSVLAIFREVLVEFASHIRR